MSLEITPEVPLIFLITSPRVNINKHSTNVRGKKLRDLTPKTNLPIYGTLNIVQIFTFDIYHYFFLNMLLMLRRTTLLMNHKNSAYEKK